MTTTWRRPTARPSLSRRAGALVIAAAALMSAGGIAAAQRPPGTPREAAVVARAAWEAEGRALRAQSARWQRLQGEDWAAAQKWKRTYGAPAESNPDFPLDRSGAEAHQAMGRAEIALRVVDADQRRLAELARAAAPQVGDLALGEAALARLAGLRAEEGWLRLQLEEWTRLRGQAWAEVARARRRYEAALQSHPEWPLDGSLADANQALGRVEASDRLLAEIRSRLAVLGRDIATASGGPSARTSVSAASPCRPLRLCSFSSRTAISFASTCEACEQSGEFCKLCRDYEGTVEACSQGGPWVPDDRAFGMGRIGPSTWDELVAFYADSKRTKAIWSGLESSQTSGCYTLVRGGGE